MGQQQMLLTVLTIIVVGIAVRIGFRVTDEQNMSQNRDQLMVQMQSIFAQAEAYAARPKTQGGGGGSYRGFTLAKRLAKTDAGTISTSVSGSSNLTITGTGKVKGTNSKTPVRVVMRVAARKIKKISFAN